MNTLGVYIQVPFCAAKCSFCNFSSRVAPAGAFADYIEALQSEIDALLSNYSRRGIPSIVFDLPVDTIYLGGGTPSLLGKERLAKLNRALRRRFCFAESQEFTIEVTPGSADEILLTGLREMGINRLSVGAQSFVDLELGSVGRLHSASDTRELVRQARCAGFENISLDLIAGLPHQTSATWQASVSAALDLKPEHVSIYLFEVDEKSRLGAEVLRHGTHFHAAEVPDDDFMAEAYESARIWLAEAGYIQYEISNFAIPGLESKHNQKYWRMEPYVGLGAGAHSFDGVRRWSNQTEVAKYQEKIWRGESPMDEIDALSTTGLLEEFFFLGLRHREGVDLAQARHRWGQTALLQWERKLARLARDGWIERREDNIALSQSSYLVSNEIFQEFLSAG